MARRIGRYEVLAELGRGGFGHVYRCLDPSLGTPVAIKVLTAEGDPGILLRFRNEAATSRRLRHPNIVTIYDIGEQNGVPYIVMELLDGEDLHRVIELRRPLSLLHKIGIMSQIATGLAHAHKDGIIHRDVKPANVMLLGDGTVKLMDFGIALITQSTQSRLTPRGAVIGSFRYMAPEQFRGSEPDARSDIFSCGLIFYELLSGVHPFHATEAAAQMYNILSIEPVPIGELCPDCPPELRPVLARLLQKDPDLRYQGLDDVLFDMEPILLKLRESRSVELVNEALLAKSRNQTEKAHRLIREALALTPAAAAARELREQLQSDMRRQALRPRIEDLVNQAHVAMAAGNPIEAVQRLESAIRLDPLDPALRNLLEEARNAEGRLKQGMQLLADAEDTLASGDAEGAARLAREALDLTPSLAGAQKVLGQAEAVLAEEKRKLRFAQESAHLQRLIEIHSWKEAWELFARLNRDFPEHSEVRILAEKLNAGQKKEEDERRLATGLAAASRRFRDGDLAQALADLETLSVQFPRSTEARSMLSAVGLEIETKRYRDFVARGVEEAQYLAAQHQFEAAIKVLDDALEKYPTDSDLQCERRAVVTASSEAAWRSAIRRAIVRAGELRSQARFAEAVQLLDSFLSSGGGDPALAELRASIIAEDEAPQREAEFSEYLQRATELVARGELESATRLLEDSPAHVRENPEITRLYDAANLQERLRAEKQTAVEDQANEFVRQGVGLVDSDWRSAKSALDAACDLHAAHTATPEVRARIEDRCREEAVNAVLQEALKLEDAGQLQAAQTVVQAALSSYPGDDRLTFRLEDLHHAIGLETRRRQHEQTLNDLVKIETEVNTAELNRLREISQQIQLTEIGFASDSQVAAKAAAIAAAVSSRLEELHPPLPRAEGKSEWSRNAGAEESVSVGDPIAGTIEPVREAPTLPAASNRRLILVGGGIAAAVFVALFAWLTLQIHRGEIPVKITSDVAGASVRIDGKNCVTPDCILKLAPGTYSLTARKDGYKPIAQQLTVPAARSGTTLPLSFEPLPQVVQVNTNFESGLVFLDGRAAGDLRDGQFSSAEVAPGQHTLRVTGGGAEFQAEWRSAAGARPELVRPITAKDVQAAVLTNAGETGSLACNCDVQSAALDSGPTGQTAAGLLKNLKEGSHQITIAGRSLVVDIRPNPTLNVFLSLDRNVGTIVVEVGQDNARIYLNDKLYRRTTEHGVLRIPADVAIYSIRAQKDGFRSPAPQTIDLKKGEERRVVLSLTAIPPVLDIAGAVPGAQVRVDGAAAGETDSNGALRMEVTPGTHEVELLKDEYKPVLFNAQFTVGETTRPDRVQITMSRIINPPDPKQTEAEDFERIRNSANPGDFDDFIRRHGDGSHVGEARDRAVQLREQKQADAARQAEQAAWDATDRGKKAAMQDFLNRFGDGAHAQEARGLIAGLEKQDALTAGQRAKEQDAATRALAEEQAITRALSAYETAYNAKDLKALQGVYVAMPKNIADPIRAEFRDARIITFQLRPTGRPIVTGNSATVDCTRVHSVTTQTGERLPPVSGPVRVTLDRSGPGWTIRSITSY